jgi:hypothetical protein
MENDIEAIDKDSYNLGVVRPVWLPYNEISAQIVSSLIDDLRYPSTGLKAQKYFVMLASLLKATQLHLSSINISQPHHIGIQRKASAWSRYPLVGRHIAKTVIDDFIQHFGGELVDGSGTSGLHKDAQGQWQTDPLMSMYTLDLGRLPLDLSQARFVEVGRPLIKVNKAETRQQKNKRKGLKLSKPFLNEKTAKALDHSAHTGSQSRRQSLNDFWRKHPLELHNGHAAASATRVFHDSRFDAGGRLYGAWTGLDQKEYRLHCKIDGEPVVEIDINASQPTLLSSLLGYKLGRLDPVDTWSDVYGELSGLINTHYYWTVIDQTIDQIDLIRRNRSVAKGVVMALIGSGLPLKSKATAELVKDFGLTPEGWLLFRDKLLETVPALNALEPRYDSKGRLDGYINGPGFLSYHESEITLATLEALMDRGIPAYPVHDCLIVKGSDAAIAAEVFRQAIHDYCKRLSGIEVMVPLSITAADDVQPDILPSESDLKGRYLS